MPLVTTTPYNPVQVLEQTQKIYAGNPEASGGFGRSVAISGDGSTIISGAFGEDGAGTDRGAGYIFTKVGGTWTQQARVINSDSGDSQTFGLAVDLTSDGNTAIIGRTTEAYIFTRGSGSPLWTEQVELNPTGGISINHNGVAISPNGSTAAVGDNIDSVTFTYTGAAHVFRKNGGSWLEETKLLPSPLVERDNVGASVSITGNGDTVIAGGPRITGGTNNRGVMHAWTREGSPGWAHEEKIFGFENLDQFGYDVDISSNGDVAIIGAALYDFGGTNRGGAAIYTRSGSTWTFETTLFASDAQDDDRFGGSVAITADGGTVVVGCLNTDKVYVFTGSGSSWEETQILDTASGDQQLSVDISDDGNIVVVGSYTDGDNGTNSGAIYIYEK